MSQNGSSFTPGVFSSLMDESGTINLLTSKRLAALHTKMVKTVDDWNLANMEKITDPTALKANGGENDHEEIDQTEDTNVSDTVFHKANVETNDHEEIDQTKDTNVSEENDHDEIDQTEDTNVSDTVFHKANVETNDHEEIDQTKDIRVSDTVEHSSVTSPSTSSKVSAKKSKGRKSKLPRKKVLPTKRQKLSKEDQLTEKVSTSPAADEYASPDSEKTFDSDSSSSFVGKEIHNDLTKTDGGI